jgi:hypothetical protein
MKNKYSLLPVKLLSALCLDKCCIILFLLNLTISISAALFVQEVIYSIFACDGTDTSSSEPHVERVIHHVKTYNILYYTP